MKKVISEKANEEIESPVWRLKRSHFKLKMFGSLIRGPALNHMPQFIQLHNTIVLEVLL